MCTQSICYSFSLIFFFFKNIQMIYARCMRWVCGTMERISSVCLLRPSPQADWITTQNNDMWIQYIIIMHIKFSSFFFSYLFRVSHYSQYNFNLVFSLQSVCVCVLFNGICKNPVYELIDQSSNHNKKTILSQNHLLSFVFFQVTQFSFWMESSQIYTRHVYTHTLWFQFHRHF